MGLRLRAEAAAAAPEPERIGGRYLVEETLGRGGMGAVYRVVDESTGRKLALKQLALSGDELEREAARLRFRREFHTMASLRHPRIVEVFDYGVDGELPYYTMELLDGTDLYDLDRVDPVRACEILRDVATALAFLHARRLLHRDLAPRNVRCTADGRAKLIDFGVMATVGVAGDVAGTPPFMAPELVYGRPLDHRVDLYGLGALAYRILTGRHAYSARNIEQLEVAWRSRPALPSALVPGIPAALDELVMALLAADPLARPASAADVIDRLGAIGGLPPIADVVTTHGWIASAALVGRQRETSQFRRIVGRARDGHGKSVLIEAPSGTGKTRLLRELGLEAQLAGMCVVSAESDAAGRGPYGIVHELARGLLSSAPDEAIAAARPRAGVLARVITTLRGQLGVKPSRPLGDPSEDRMALQNELVAWMLDVAAVRPIAFLVDDVQRCDEASAAVLATLAHRGGDRRLVVAAALRTDEPVRAPAAIAALCDAGQRFRLRGLEETDLVELFRSLFGDVPHLARLAHWMHRVAGGSPLYTTELARHLVDNGVIRYLDGLWTVPEDLGRHDLPQGLAAAMDARVRALPAPARSLGEVLSVHGGELPLGLVVTLADTKPEAEIDKLATSQAGRKPGLLGAEAEVFAALDRLVFDEILIQTGEAWRFRHDGLREAMLRGIDDARRRALHLRVGEALAQAAAHRTEDSDFGAGGGDVSGAADSTRAAEIGWHLLRGGDARRGAALLERAGRGLYDAQSFSDCIAPLDAALEVMGTRRRTARARLEILHMLLMAGCMADRKTALRHADACVAGFRYWSGVDVATGAGKLVGRHAGLAIGILWAAVRWLVSFGRGPNPYYALRTFFIVVGYTASMHSLAFDIPKIEATVKLVDPIAIFKNRVPYAVYLLTRNTLHYPRGEIGHVRRNARRLLEILETDRITPISDLDRRTGGGGARYMLVMIAVTNLEPTWREELDELAKIRLKFYDLGAEQAKVVWHRIRGEEEAAAAIEAKVELMFVQLGSVWQMEAFMPVIAMLAYAFARDTLGLRRTIEQLDRLCRDGFKYDPYLRLARGEYLRERGDAAASRAELEPLVTDRGQTMLHLAAMPALAETLLALGELPRAREVAGEAIQLCADPETGNLNAELRSVRALALIETALGEHAAAAARLDAAIARAADRDSPLLSGTLHEARARVALAIDDTIAFHQHLAETEHYFRRSRNPALIARAERLAEAGARRERRQTEHAGAPEHEPATAASSPSARRRERDEDVSIIATEAVTTPAPDSARGWVSAVLSGCRGAAERAARALQLIVAEAHGASGYLYLRGKTGLELAAPAVGDEPPPELAKALARAILERDESPTVADLPRDLDAGSVAPEWKPIALTLRLPRAESGQVGAGHAGRQPGVTAGEGEVVVGGVAVIAGAMPLVEPDRKLLAEIARELFEAGDVTHTRTVP